MGRCVPLGHLNPSADDTSPVVGFVDPDDRDGHRAVPRDRHRSPGAGGLGKRHLVSLSHFYRAPQERPETGPRLTTQGAAFRGAPGPPRPAPPPGPWRLPAPDRGP